VFVTVRTAPELENFRCNLRAPLLVSAGRGFQVINEAEDAPVRAPLFEALATAGQTAA
jgi:flagellar assembly factor FliW